MLTKQVAGRVYNYGFCIGKSQPIGPGFLNPVDFALGSGGSLYVVSRGNPFIPCHGITKCTLDHEFIWESRGPSFANGQSPWPMSINVDSNENLYVSDDYTSLIHIFDKDGTLLDSWGAKGSGDGELNGPSGLAFDKQDNLFIVDGLNHRVQKFTKDGMFLAKWGSQGSGEGQFNMPWGIAIDKQGDVYVADWKNDRVQKLSPEGKYLATFGKPGTGEGELQHPSDVAIDNDGDVYVTDWENERVNVYTSDGTFLADFIGDAETLSPWGQDQIDANLDFQRARQRADRTPEFRFRKPVSVNVDDQGRIMVLETQNSRIQVYVKELDYREPQFNL